jgi:hypothetical protein
VEAGKISVSNFECGPLKPFGKSLKIRKVVGPGCQWLSRPPAHSHASTGRRLHHLTHHRSLRSSMLRPTPSLSSHLKGGRARPYPFRCFFPGEAAAAALLFQRCHRYRRALRALHGPSNPWSRNTLSHSRCLLSRLRTQRTVVVAGFSPTTVAATPFPVRAAVVRLIVPLFVGLISA